MIIERKTAKAKGLTKYFTGRPCSAGHISFRRVKNGVCLECVRQHGFIWYKNNREYKLEKSRRVYVNNRPNILARTGRYSLENREKVRGWQKDWVKKNRKSAYEAGLKYRKSHPEKIAEWNRTQRAKRKLSQGKHTNEDVKLRLKWQRGCCAACKTKLNDSFQIDHYIPLSRGGHNNPSNIQLLCKSCNCRKHAKDPLEFYRNMGFLL